MSKQPRPVHEGNAFNRDFIAMTLPLYLMAFFYYGPRVFLMALVGVVTARLCDRFSAMLRSQRYDATENTSTVIALLIVLMMPATVRYRVVVAAVIIGVLVAKEAFGGYRSYPFNPAAVGFCAVAVAWPAEMFQYPAPLNWALLRQPTFDQLLRLWRFEGVTLVEGPSSTLKAGGLPKEDIWNLLLGNFPGALGVTCSVVMVACALFLLIKGRMSLTAPLCFLGAIALIAFVFPRHNEINFQTWPQDIPTRLEMVKYELLCGGTLFAAVFLVPEPGTLPRNTLSRVIYGLLLGLATMMFRYFGSFELGICFAFLIVNAVSGYFDRAIANRFARRKGAALP